MPHSKEGWEMQPLPGDFKEMSVITKDIGIGNCSERPDAGPWERAAPASGSNLKQ